MALAISTIANSISGLTVSGVIIKDIDEVPESGDDRSAILYPKPDGFVTDLRVQPDSFGTASTRKYTVTYALHYMLVGSPIGSGRGIFDKYSDMVGKAFAVLDAAIAAVGLVGAVEFSVQGVSNFGPVADNSGNPWHGCEIAFLVTEFVN
jgi:hypothetical protein